MEYTKETFLSSLEWLEEEESKHGLNQYALGRFEMAKECKNLILSSVLKPLKESKQPTFEYWKKINKYERTGHGYYLKDGKLIDNAEVALKYRVYCKSL